MATKSMIVIHHAGKGGDNSTYRSIETNHIVNRGYSAVAYHRVIERSGKVYRGRRDRRSGGHTVGRDLEDNILFNRKGLGVCLCGNFDNIEVPPAQWKSLVSVVARWCIKHNIYPCTNTIVGHKDLQPTKRKKTGEIKQNTCPGKNVYDKIPLLITQVTSELKYLMQFSSWEDVDWELDLE